MRCVSVMHAAFLGSLEGSKMGCGSVEPKIFLDTNFFKVTVPVPVVGGGGIGGTERG